MTIEFFQRDADGVFTPAPYERFTFPAGEQSVRERPEGSPEDEQFAYVEGANANDLIALRMWSAIAQWTAPSLRAFIPYLPGARDDKAYAAGAIGYADLINAAALDEVICFDPHSPVMPSLVNNCTTIDAAALIASEFDGRGIDIDGVIIPDHGAVERSKRIAALLGVPTYQATKHRDPSTGKLSGFSCELLPDTGRMLIADDICDGGGTFMGLAEATGLDRDRLVLWVSHGVFSNGAKKLAQHYGLIVTTDSFPSITPLCADITVPLRQYLFDQLPTKES